MEPKNTFHLLPFILLCLFSTQVTAADPAAGKQKAALCAGCHGQDGNSSNPQWPSLAGQQPTYLVNQLQAFQSGTRNNPTMQGMADSLTKQDMANLAAYFSKQPLKSAGGDQQLAKTGDSLFNMCSGCHGASAEGRGNFPRLAGQQPGYIETQLNNFKSGARKSGPMQSIAANLSAADIKALAAYLGTLK